MKYLAPLLALLLLFGNPALSHLTVVGLLCMAVGALAYLKVTHAHG